MSSRTPAALMQSAWAARRDAFDANPAERAGALTAAKEDLVTAAEMLRDDGPPVSYARALHLRAHLEMDLGQAEQALALWEEAVDVLRGSDDELQLAHKLRHLGDVHCHLGRLQEAGAHYAEALSLYRLHDGLGSLDFANALRRTADLEERLGRRADAAALWRETRERYSALGVTAGVEEAERRLGGLEALGPDRG